MKSFKILLLVCLSVYTSCFDKTDILKSFINQPKQLFKTYYTLFEKHNEYDINTPEGVKRYSIFNENVKRIQALNKELGKETYGFTQFVDMTHEEFKDKYLMKPLALERLMSEQSFEKNVSDESENAKNFLSEEDTENFDFSDAVGNVKNQGGCGSCWAFAAIAVIESRYMQLNGAYREFSEQHLVDCDNYDYGCGGGWPTNTLKWMFENGVQDQKLKPYAGVAKACDRSLEKSKSLWIVKNMISKDYAGLTKQLFLKDLKEKGPFIVVMDAGTEDISLYKPASLDNPLPGKNCKNINHAVTAIGKKGNLIYVRNSWGKWWGFNGNFSVTIEEDCFITRFGFGAVLGVDSNPGNYDDKKEDIPDDDTSDDNDNQACLESFYTDCNFLKERKLKNCDFFTDADGHFGNLNQIKGILSKTRHWVFYDQPHCKGAPKKFLRTSTGNICFDRFGATYSNIKSGHAIDKSITISPSQVLLSNDFCLGGRKILVSSDEKKSSWGEGFVPKSVVFSSWNGTSIVRGVLLFEGEGFTGKSCYLKKEVNEDPTFGNVTCDISGVKSLITIKGYPISN